MSSSNQSTASTEVLRAIRNAAKLLASLAGTLLVAFVVRFWLPRFLGPDAFGILRFAEDYAATFFIIGTLGVDVYIRKEIATRPEHASEFFGSLTLLRLGISLLLTLAMVGVLWIMGKDAGVYALALLFAAGQVFFVLNGSLSALLQATGDVTELSIGNLVTKFLWGIGAVVGLLLGGGLTAVALAFLASEALKLVVLYWASRRHLALQLRLDWRALWLVLVASAPLFINILATTIYARIDITMLSGLTTDAEVGWYGAAINLTFIVHLLQPILNAVLLPMGARIAQESEEAMNETMRGAIRMVLIMAVPTGLLIALNARDVVELLYGDDYGPSVRICQVLTLLVPLTYVCNLWSVHLIQLDRTWTLVKISAIGLAINPLLNALLIGRGHALLGDGGGGLAAAGASVVTEGTVAILLFVALGSTARDSQLARLVFRFVLVCAAMTGAHWLAAPLGVWRAPLEIPLYILLAWPLGAMPLRDIIGRTRAALARKRADG